MRENAGRNEKDMGIRGKLKFEEAIVHEGLLGGSSQQKERKSKDDCTSVFSFSVFCFSVFCYVL